MPLPDHIDGRKVIEAIDPEKDMDCFTVVNTGLLMTGQPRIKPCTPYGVMKMLESIDYPLRGAHAVIVGASNIGRQTDVHAALASRRYRHHL